MLRWFQANEVVPKKPEMVPKNAEMVPRKC